MGVHAEAVQKLYVAYFGRPADYAGLHYWEQMITRANGSTAEVSAAFAASQEYKDLFAGLDAYGIVDLIYHNLFGRGAELAGLNYWAQGLKRHDFTIADAVTTIAQAARGADLVAYTNKVVAATAFTNELDTTTEVLSYTGWRANGILQEWLARVTTDESLQAALAGLDEIVAEVANPGPARPVGLFEQVNIASLPAVFDAEPLAAHKQAIEFVADSPATARSLSNLAPSSTLRIEGDLGSAEVTLAQKMPGALKIVFAADKAMNGALASVTANIVASNATTINAFLHRNNHAGLLPDMLDQVNLNLTGSAESLNLHSSGPYTAHVVNYKDATGALDQITVTGDRPLTLATQHTHGLALIDASQQFVGGLTASTASLRDGGLIKLGSFGNDHITLADAPGALRTDAIKSIQSFQRSSDDVPFDMLLVAGARVANANPGVAAGTIERGVLKFSGAEPASLDAAVAIASAAAESEGELLLFTWHNDSYVFAQGWGAEDLLVRLVGTTGVHGVHGIGDEGKFWIF